ncbi:MAG: SsrA-binding protein SmpB [Chloroflexi bacterium]|nr:SsrA-binding protein SmpB [Chloroflexota bacterium]MDA1272125.1 SsrA-binding protein SmpB [Chloroflexota bacterium]
MAKKKSSTPTIPANKKAAAPKAAASDFRPVASNRKANFDYEILERYEAGISLTGTEIKSIRAGKIDLRDAYARTVNGEMWLYNVYIAPYDPASANNHDPMRARKLLLHRAEILRITASAAEKGLTIVALRVYIKKHVAKVELGLARGKRQYDKRRTIMDRDMDREARRAMGANRG